MPHFRIDPAKELEYLSQRMKKFIDEFPETFSFEIGKGFEPKTDVLHDATHVFVHVELAGVPKEAVAISLKDDILTISGTRNPAYDPEKIVPARIERAFGNFSKRITLPAEVRQDSVTANLTDGVLVVVFEKAKKQEEQDIKINIL